MKTLFILSAFLLSSVGFAQEQTKNVGDFSELKVFDLINVKLVSSNENKIVILGENADDVEVVNKNGKLKIRMKLDKIFNGEDTTVKVYYTNLETIDANEGAQVESLDKIKQKKIELKTQEGGQISVDLKVDKLEVKAISGGIIETEGKANQQNVAVNTGGQYEGENLKTEKTTISAKTGGNAEVYASKKVKAKVMAGGNIEVYGNPSDVDKSVTFGGEIIIKE